MLCFNEDWRDTPQEKIANLINSMLESVKVLKSANT